MTSTKLSGNILLKMHPFYRVLVSLVLSAITYFFIRDRDFAPLLKFMMLWDVFSLSYIITCWIVLLKRSTSQIKLAAQQEDGGRFFVFIVILVSAFVSMFAVLLLILSKDTAKTPEAVYLPIAISGMLLSWFMIHTTFCFHYAHLYYESNTDKPNGVKGGLLFPEEENPDYLDFAYFSFVIGMTFQVSDVEISARQIRRLALVHGLLSFGLNTFVVAMTINIIAGLKN